MLLYFTEATAGTTVAINPKFVVAVFVAPPGESEGHTVISLINGTALVKESDLDVVGRINGEL
jgi:uncharacterized protein YlzI (FlbEa/FlbD family)